MKEIEHKKEVEKLNELEGQLINLILETGNEELFEKFVEWQGQRTKCNRLYLEWIKKIIDGKTDVVWNESLKQQEMKEENNVFKKLGEESDDRLFTNFGLTELMILRKNGRRVKANENNCLHLLLTEKLKEYGLSLFGQFESDGLEFRSVRMLEGFPLENEPILSQLYGYTGFTAHVQLRGFDNFAAAFDYNVDTRKCELQRHCYGTVTNRIQYGTLSEMLADIKLKGYDNIFNNDQS